MEPAEPTTKQTADSALNTEPAKGSFNAEQEMLKIRKDLKALFWIIIISVLVMLGATVGVMLLLSFSQLKAVEKGLIVRLIQISFGMTLGAACVFFGVMVSWLSITASYTFGGELEKGKLNLQSTSPALALIVGGIILIGVSLYKEVKYTETPISVGEIVQPDESAPPPP